MCTCNNNNNNNNTALTMVCFAFYARVRAGDDDEIFDVFLSASTQACAHNSLRLLGNAHVQHATVTFTY